METSVTVMLFLKGKVIEKLKSLGTNTALKNEFTLSLLPN